jgi:hypothetical protein
VAPVCKSTIVERQKARPTPLAAVLYGQIVYSDEPLPEIYKCPPFRKSPTPQTLGPGQTNGRPATVYWDNICTCNVAPRISWERFKRSKPQNELGSDRMGGMSKEASHLHTHFHIFASLPGLNGSANNRHRVGLLINSVLQNYHRKPKKQGGVRLICLLRI